MAKVKGKVEVVSPNKAGNYGIKLDNGKWYGTFEKSAPCSVGETVEIDFAERGNFNNVTKGGLTVLAAAPAQAADSGKSSGSGGVDWELKDQKIQWQSARNAAIDLVSVLLAHGGIAFKATAKEKDKAEIIEAQVYGYTEQFFNDSVNLGSTPDDAQAGSAVAAGADNGMAGEE